MREKSITKFRLNPASPSKTDWAAFDAMTEEDRAAAARSDPDARPATAAQLARAVRRPNVQAIRRALALTQEEFAHRFGLPLGTVRDWEQGAHAPDRAAVVLLAVIASHPEAVEHAVHGRRAKKS